MYEFFIDTFFGGNLAGPMQVSNIDTMLDMMFVFAGSLIVAVMDIFWFHHHRKEEITEGQRYNLFSHGNGLRKQEVPGKKRVNLRVRALSLSPEKLPCSTGIIRSHTVYPKAVCLFKLCMGIQRPGKDKEILILACQDEIRGEKVVF